MKVGDYMRYIKNFTLLILFCVLVLFVTGCRNSYNDFGKYHIVKKDMFLQEENEYYIFIYSTTCTVCSQIEEEVVKYANKAISDSSYIKLYFLNIGDKINNGGIKCASNDECNMDFLGADSYSQIQIEGPPCLIKIKDGKVVSIFDGKTKIKNQLAI